MLHHENAVPSSLARGPRACCSDLDLDRLILGELDDAEAVALRVHLQSSSACQARHHLIATQHDAWRQQPPALQASLATVVPISRRRPWVMVSTVGATLAMAAGVAMIVMPTTPDIRTKGIGLRASFAHQTGADVFDGDSVQLPATLAVTVRMQRAGAFMVDVATGGALPIAVVAAMTTTADTPTTTTLTLPTGINGDAQLRVLACDRASSLAAQQGHVVADEGCSIDAIRVRLVAEPLR
jgi:anti-sigma factor RsiW